MIDSGVCYDASMEAVLFLAWLLFQNRDELRHKIREAVRFEIHSPLKAKTHGATRHTIFAENTV